MKQILAAGLMAATIAAPAHANWFGGGPSCEAADVACLKEQALATIVQEINDNDPQNHSGAGRRYGLLVPLLNGDEAVAAEQRFEEAGAGDAFWGIYDRDRGEAVARKSMNYEGILSAVEGRGYPRAIEWRDFISDAIYQTLNGPDASKLVDLYLRETAFFEQYAQGSTRFIVAHMARSDIEAAEAFGRDADKPKAPLYRALSMIGDAAAATCASGDLDLGKRIMALRDTHAQTQQYSPELAFLPLMARFRYILACDGEAAALEELTKIETGLDAIPKGQIVKYKGLEMSIDRMRDNDLREDVIRPLAYHLFDTGRQAQARALFDKYVGPSFVIGYDPSSDTNITAANALDHPAYANITASERTGLQDRIEERLQYEWENDLEIRASQPRYAADPATRLAYYADVFDPKFEICCADGDTLEDMVDDIVAASGTLPVPPKAISRAWELTQRAKAQGKRPGSNIMPVVAIKLATAETYVGCALDDDRLNELLAEVEQLDEPSHQFAGLLGMIAYHQAPVSPRGDAACVIR